ncbi:hypothetical protein [Streptomyces sp. NBC_00076]|uniref:hypothetical protein n=1 Tax=Streptomyces sp. NBC_00076 TaxID=2975642 RepID=UPI0032503BAA
MTVHAASEPRHLGPDHGSPAGFEQRCARAGRQHGAPARVGHTLGAQLTGLLDSGLLAEEYPLRPRLRALADTLLHDVVRTVALAPPDAERSSAAIAKETTSLDLALAHRFAKHHDDPVLRFPSHVGERSVADAPTVLDTPCACGRALVAYRRRGRVPTIIDTVQVVCARCGDVANSLADSAKLTVKAPSEVLAGGTLHVVVEAERAGTVNLGIVLPVYLDARVGPVLRRVEASRPGERVHAEFTVGTTPGATPQAYCFCPYAVQDLGISVSRVHFTLGPAAGTDETE